ncbi:MAG: hypothetical protein O7I42_13850 [Alphaproteobacteria bacterium]|nr:hypothetical protein [Alphaproteobacteria bacterium]
MKNKTISVIAAAAISIGIGFAAISSATAAPAVGAMQAAQAGIQKSEITQVRHYRRNRHCFRAYRWGRRWVRTYYGWRYVPYRYFVGYRCNYRYRNWYGY